MYIFLGQLSMVINFIIYGVMNKIFRDEYKKLFKWSDGVDIIQDFEEILYIQESKCFVFQNQDDILIICFEILFQVEKYIM